MKINSLLSSVLIYTFSIFIIFGNLFRILNAGFHFNLLISEFALYFLSFLMFILIQPFVRFIIISSLIILLSAAYGIKTGGINFFALLQAFRLVAMLISGITLGKVFFNKYGNNIIAFMKYFQNIYIFNLAFGFLIFLIFPNSIVLWAFLGKFGIEIKGDPHLGRLVSTYFDPNFFGAICCIPFMISFLIKKKMTLWTYLFLLGIFLTFSRSGIVTLVLVIACLSMNVLKKVYVKFSRKSLYVPVFIILPILLLAIIYREYFFFFLNRFINMKADQSAVARFDSFSLGIQFLFNNPILGVGYNFIDAHISEAYCINSSFLVSLLAFGIPLTCLFLTALILWIFSIHYKLTSFKSKDIILPSFFNQMVCYLVICIIFSCHFNNLIFYPFWLIPVLTIFSYIALCAYDQSIQCSIDHRNNVKMYL